MLSVCKLKSPVGLEKLFSLPLQQIDYDWFGERMNPAPQFVLAVDTAKLYFGAIVHRSAWFDPAHKQGDFVEGLWNKDVAEIFITNSDSPEYQEFNLSPGAAWWSCFFSKHRKRDPSKFKMPKNIDTISEVASSSWKVAMSIHLDELSLPVSLEDSTRINVSFALGKTKRQYLTWANIDSPEPDFHRAEQFEDLDLVEV